MHLDGLLASVRAGAGSLQRSLPRALAAIVRVLARGIGILASRLVVVSVDVVLVTRSLILLVFQVNRLFRPVEWLNLLRHSHIVIDDHRSHFFVYLLLILL